jgi:hypothetical protein
MYAGASYFQPAEKAAAKRIQLFVLEKVFQKHRLDRALFVERLLFEKHLTRGSVRLFLQLTCFFLLFWTLQNTSHNWSARLIIWDLTNAFNLNSLPDIGTALGRGSLQLCA